MPKSCDAATLGASRCEERLGGRRLVLFALNLASVLALGATMASLGGGSPAWMRLAILAPFLAGLPWTLLAFWNSLIGFVILRLVKDPAGYTNPALGRATKHAPITTQVALCLAVRHESVEDVFARLEAMIGDLWATPWRHRFAFHLLSDSSRAEVVAAEERLFAGLRARYPQPGLLHYRRRRENLGFKAGNLREFAERTAGTYDFMIALDADSLMSAEAILRLTRVMQANPRLGILQTLVVGLPTRSTFARVFQFGMRHAMRLHTVGIAWWQGPSGPYWGHNAIIRLDAFLSHCPLPVLRGHPPLGGHILSHDQVEAALMRAAGYEVRVIADERESWEEHPASLPEFIKRDLRWCQGNVQYLRLLARPGFKAMGRFQMANAIMMYLGAPFWVLMLATGLVSAALGAGTASANPSAQNFPTALAFILYMGMLMIGFAPRLLGVLDVLLRPVERARYGGGGRLLAGAFIDAGFNLLLGPILMIAQSLFLAGLACGRRVAWEASRRGDHRVPILEALYGLWPQLCFGAVFAAGTILLAPGGLPWAAPMLASCLLAIPFASATASARLGNWMTRNRLCAIPDECAPAPILRGLRDGDSVAPRRAA